MVLAAQPIQRSPDRPASGRAGWRRKL